MSVIVTGCLIALAVAAALVLIRLLLGPTPADRVLALDTLLLVVTMAVALWMVRVDDYARYAPLLLVITLLAFLGTVAAARFIERNTAAPRHERHPPPGRVGDGTGRDRTQDGPQR